MPQRIHPRQSNRLHIGLLAVIFSIFLVSGFFGPAYVQAAVDPAPAKCGTKLKALFNPVTGAELQQCVNAFHVVANTKPFSATAAQQFCNTFTNSTRSACFQGQDLAVAAHAAAAPGAGNTFSGGGPVSAGAGISPACPAAGPPSPGCTPAAAAGAGAAPAGKTIADTPDPAACAADTAHAIQGCDPGATCDKNNCDFITKYLNPFINLFTIIFGLLAAISLIIGGIQYASSAGDPQKASAAKGRISKTVMAFFAYAFLYGFLQFLVPGGAFK